MKFPKFVAFFVFVAANAALSFPTCSQPIEKPVEAELPTISIAALSDLVGGPTKIPLHYENAALDSVVKDASQKFEVSFALSARTGAKGPITLDLPPVPLWTAWEALRNQVQYDRTAATVAPRNALVISPLAAERPYLTSETPLFQVRALGARVSEKAWTLTLYIVADPKIELAPSSGRVHITEATDDEGNNLMNSEIRTSLLYQTMPSVYYSALSQDRPAKLGKRVHLRGTVTAYAILKREPWEVDLNTAHAEKTIENHGVREVFSVTGVSRDEDKERYKLELSRALKSLINYRFWGGTQTRFNTVYNYALFSDVQLLDAQGRKFYQRGTGADANYDNETYLYNWTGRFGRTPENRTADEPLAEGEPAKLIWNLPGELHRFEMPFELNDVPLNY